MSFPSTYRCSCSRARGARRALRAGRRPGQARGRHRERARTPVSSRISPGEHESRTPAYVRIGAGDDAREVWPRLSSSSRRSGRLTSRSAARSRKDTKPCCEVYVTQKREMGDDDPTQGRRHGERPDDDPTQGRRHGERPDDDPTQGPQYGERPDDDPTQGPQYGERPDDDLTRRERRSGPRQPISPTSSSRGPAVAEPHATLPRPTLRGAGTHDETDPRATPLHPTLRGAGTHGETDPRARRPSPTLRGAGERH